MSADRDPFDTVYPRTFGTEAELVQAAREIMVCANCDRALDGDDGEPCPERLYVTGCTFWKRRAPCKG